MSNAIEHPPSFKLGNIWLVAANLARTAADIGSGAPMVVTIDADGMLEAVGPDHPDYSQRLVAPGFVCTVSAASSNERIAGRIRAAATALEISS